MAILLTNRILPWSSSEILEAESPPSCAIGLRDIATGKLSKNSFTKISGKFFVQAFFFQIIFGLIIPSAILKRW
jgi:hypothetical protein